MASSSPAVTQDEHQAHVVRFEIPPMMRYCAGTCPCTWVTALALPNLVLFRHSLRIGVQGKESDMESPVVYNSMLRGESRHQEIKLLGYLIPAQSLMGLSSYFAWYYGYGFYGPAKYPLLIYGLTLACHSAAQEGEIVSNPKFVLAHRAVCAVGTFLCSCCFLRLSKFSSLLMLPACGIYFSLTYVSVQGINSGNTNSNEDETEDLSYNENNNQERGNSAIDDAAEQPHHHHELIESETQQQQHSGQQPQHTGPQQQPPPPPPYHPVQMQKRRKKRRKSILKLDDVENGERDRGVRRPSKSNVSFNDAVAVKYHHRNSSVLSTSLSSSSLSSREDDRENIVSQR